MNRPDPSNVDSLEVRLLVAAAGGDREARRRLFEQNREAAYRVAFRITGRHEDALDVVQDAFIRAFEGLAGFQREAGFRAWLLRIVSNRALDLLRSRKVRLAVSLHGGDEEGGPQVAAPAAEPPWRRLEAGETAERIQAAMESLPVEQRTVLAMYAAGEMTYGEIAAALGVPIGTVMSRLYHARMRLKSLLADLDPGGGGREDELATR